MNRFVAAALSIWVAGLCAANAQAIAPAELRRELAQMASRLQAASEKLRSAGRQADAKECAHGFGMASAGVVLTIGLEDEKNADKREEWMQRLSIGLAKLKATLAKCEEVPI